MTPSVPREKLRAAVQKVMRDNVDRQARLAGAPFVIIWVDPLPGEVRDAFGAALLPVLSLAPAWLHTLNVRWEPNGPPSSEDDGGPPPTLSVVASPEYREATVFVGPTFLSEQARERLNLVRHEFLHLPLAEMDAVVVSLLARLKESQPEFHAFAAEQYRRALEGAVCDLTRALGDVLR